MNNLTQTLGKIGLTEKEASLYLAALSAGTSGMSKLAQKARLKRSTAYLTFKSLEQKGLLGSFKTRDGLKFSATRPESLLAKTKNNLTELEEAIPFLKAVSEKEGQKPKITYYEGNAGYLAMCEEILQKPNTTLRHMGSLAELHKVIKAGYDNNHIVPTRIKNNIFLKALYTKDSLDTIEDPDHLKNLREIRCLPNGYDLRVSTIIYEGAVILMSSQEELITVKIESRDIAAGEIAKFDMIWDLLGPQGKWKKI